MDVQPTNVVVADWRTELPTLGSGAVVLREPVDTDLGALLDLLSTGDARRFGIQHPVSESAVRDFINAAQRDRAAGLGFTYAVILSTAESLAGLVQVRQIGGSFEAGECQALLAPSCRGTGVFVEAARLVESFAFEFVGAYRLEARVPLENGRANGALQKLGAVQEGVLRRSLRQNGEYLDQVLWSVLKEDRSAPCFSMASRVQ